MRHHALLPGCLVVLLLLLCAQEISAADEPRGVAKTKHNLTASGPGSIKSSDDKFVCGICHIPHMGNTASPAWSRNKRMVYKTYKSPTAKASIGQPTGASRLCLTCHDGTVAISNPSSSAGALRKKSSLGKIPSGKSNLGTDLSDDHPVSFVYDNALAAKRGELAMPTILQDKVRLDETGQLQCTSCHDAHHDQFGKFLMMENKASALCLTCHTIKGWSGSSHRYSTATWNGSPPDPWPNTEYRDVALNACGNCHRPHSAPGKVWLLNAKREEDTCFACHNGNVASKNIKKEFEKPYRHPVQTKGNEHTPTEDLLWGQRHVQCADCHSPHGVNETSAKPPIAPGAIAQVGGISSSGSPVSPLKYEYELCYRCHADNPGSRAAIVTRNIFEKNIRLKFKSTNASYHPVEAIGQNRNVPSLILPLTTSSYIYCTDCHNSDAASSAGGTAPKGPHGSLWEGLLTRQLITRDSTQESPQSYSLCYTCHNRNSILSNQSFPLHRQHIVDRNAPCTACHDPHGVEKSKHLINFDTTIVSPNSKGQLQYVSAGMQTGTCSLKCHNKNHDREAYPLSSKSLLPAGSQHQEQRHNQALPRPQNKGRNR